MKIAFAVYVGWAAATIGAAILAYLKSIQGR